ncbi:hypothetical protein F5J12DRAFT_706886, partial [Pisolithus orientalis]|uniref:uncharacterized protein n=1 Tax=Pisolithus orientalis TaxID=936130 RepID=UPI002224E5C5
DAIKEMCSRITTPVDMMGCDQAQSSNRCFTTLISLMLSSQTKDEVTDAAVAKLHIGVGGSLSVDTVIAVEEA